MQVHQALGLESAAILSDRHKRLDMYAHLKAFLLFVHIDYVWKIFDLISPITISITLPIFFDRRRSERLEARKKTKTDPSLAVPRLQPVTHREGSASLAPAIKVSVEKPSAPWFSKNAV